ncbi:MAG: lysophospholipid acyltransferase family protein [Flavobacteriaceae bacterium]
MIEIWYQFMRKAVHISLIFYFKKIKLHGTENVPKKGPILFVSNHPNALIDPLIIKTGITKNLYVLTRAGVFKNNFISKLFDSFKMIPIYRKRDGLSTISKNEAIFDRCFDILNDGKSILIFPEGSHSLLKKVRPLSKGFTRITFGAFEKYPDLNFQIVPIGLNYQNPTEYPDSAAIYFGKPIIAKDYYNPNDLFLSIDLLKEATQQQMQKLTTHIEGNHETYEKTLGKLIALNADFTNPFKTNNLIKEIDNISAETTNKQSKNTKNLLYYLVLINSIIPWLIWNKVRKGIKELEFTSTFRLAVGAILFPMSYIIQSFIIHAFFDKKIALIYFSLSLLSCVLLPKTLKVNE